MSNDKLLKLTNSTFKHNVSVLICCEKDINANQFAKYYIYKEPDFISCIMKHKNEFDLIIITEGEIPELNLYPCMEWNALFANQTYRYYDIKNWKSSTINTQQHYPKDTGFIAVDSAYGGLAIYKSKSIQSSFKAIPANIMELNLKILTNKFLDCSLQLETTQDKEKLYQDFL